MIIICAWCNKKIGWKPGKGESHGICRKCEKKWLKGLKTQKIRRVLARIAHEIKILIKFCRTSPADVRAAIVAASEGQATWRQMELEIARI